MRRYTIEVGDARYVIDVEELTLERFQVQVEGQRFDVRLTADESLGGVAITPAPALPTSPPPGPPAPVPDPVPARPATPALNGLAGTGRHVVAPMPGTVLAVAVAPGEQVEAGQAVLTLEAMKMQNTLRAPRAGTVTAILVHVGQQVAFGETLVQLEEARP